MIWFSRWAAIFCFLLTPAAAEGVPLQTISVDEALEIFGLLEAPKEVNERKVSLGKQLFHDPRLSANNQVSCASCHILEQGGDDNRRFSIGVSGAPSARNSPTVFNLANQIAYFWDGRAETLVDQIEGPIHHPDEMASDWETIVKKLNADSVLSSLFKEQYGVIDSHAIKDAVAAFEETLVTDDSPFDDFMRGDSTALSTRAKRGLSRFLDYGCASCHQGPTMGGNVFQRFGVYEEGKDERPLLKVPSLRNVGVTGPYFNDGREVELAEAVRIMARVQLSRDLDDEEIQDIVAFLHSLSGFRFNNENSLQP